MGWILPRPWVVDGEIIAWHIVQLSLVFDHRVCDGGTAGHGHAVPAFQPDGRIRPLTSPKPTRAPRAPGAVAEMVTSSPSSRKVRVLPSARDSGSAPPQLSSISEPRWSFSGPLTVPEA